MYDDCLDFPPIMQFEDNVGEMTKWASGEHLDRSQGGSHLICS